MEAVLKIDAVKDYMNLRRQDVLHPLIGIVDFDKVREANKIITGYTALHFNCYAIFLKDSVGCKLKYGGQNYDYDEGTLVFIEPGQTVGLSYGPNYQPKGYALLFHPDLLLGTELDRKMSQYNFFSYNLKEALHLSVKERKIVLGLFEKIQFELDQSVDRHSKKLIVKNLELFLEYCMRFYERQFITREQQNQGFLYQFNEELNNYFKGDTAQKNGAPCVNYFAERLQLSPNYFGDLVKRETGTSALEYIQRKLIEVAKEKIVNQNKAISEIAYELGFKYPQHFSRLFKQKVGYAPNAYRVLY